MGSGSLGTSLLIWELAHQAGTIDFEGIKADWDENFSLPKDYLLEDVEETIKYLHEQVGKDLPDVIQKELDNQRQRIQTQL
ncbi:unnamed protein product [Trichobilharzia regenti]|nr:unnamed protein product [Trichobilharzia regenti]